MRVLWFLNSPIGIASEYLSSIPSQSGTWIDATMSALLNESEDVVLGIAAYNAPRTKVDINGRVIVYGVGESAYIGKNSASSNERVVIQNFVPDIIQIWGTEFSFGKNIIAFAQEKNIPVLFYIQGVISAISKYHYGGLKLRTLAIHSMPLGIAKAYKLYRGKRDLEKQAKIEKKMIAEANGIIADNDWVKAYFSEYARKVYDHTTPVNEVFLNKKWQPKHSDSKQIMTIGLTNAGKGIHKLLEALIVVKKRYPGVKLIIPGAIHFGIKENPYISYIRWFIRKHSLDGNVEFCGQLSSEQMADRLLQSDVFVNPSYIENISTSLREAMYLGLPCITSQVGSLHEIVHYGINGFTYRYEESEVLAYEIIKLLSDEDLACKISENARNSIKKYYPQRNVAVELLTIYKRIAKK